MEHRFEREKGPGTLLLLHSTGGDENQLIPVGRMLDPDANLLSPRGQVEEAGARRFFRRLGEGVFDLDDLREKTLELAGFLEATEFEYDLDPARLFAVGYSNGANIAAANLLLTPDLLRGAVLLRPQLPLTPDPLPTLQPIPVTLLAGTEDAVVAPSSTEALAKILSRCGAQVEVHWQKAGHELTPEDFASVKQALIKMIF